MLHVPWTVTLADADGDGTIDKAEFAMLMAAAGGGKNADDAAALFAAVDADGDGELTAEEIQSLTALKRTHSLKAASS